MPETSINFQKEEEEIFKEIKINSRTSHQEITMSPSHRKLQRQKWHPAQSLKRNWWRESQEPSTKAFATSKEKAGAALWRWREIGDDAWPALNFPLWWGLNTDEGRHLTSLSRLGFFPLKSSCQERLHVRMKMAGHSQRPVVLTLAFSYGTNKLLTKWSHCLLTLKLWEAFSDVFPEEKAYQDEQEEKARSLWGRWLTAWLVD